MTTPTIALIPIAEIRIVNPRSRNPNPSIAISSRRLGVQAEL